MTAAASSPGPRQARFQSPLRWGGFCDRGWSSRPGKRGSSFNPLFVGAASATCHSRAATTRRPCRFQSPLRWGGFCDGTPLPCGRQQRRSFNPLFVGAASATCDIGVDCTVHSWVSIPSSLGRLLRPLSQPRPRFRTSRGFNPLFVGAASATQPVAPHQRGATAVVSIPSSLGRLLRPMFGSVALRTHEGVSIPSSLGRLLRPRSAVCFGRNAVRFNPLFVGAASATRRVAT